MQDFTTLFALTLTELVGVYFLLNFNPHLQKSYQKISKKFTFIMHVKKFIILSLKSFFFADSGGSLSFVDFSQ